MTVKNCQESLVDHFLLLKEASGTHQTLPRSSPSGVQITFSATSDLFLVTIDFLESALGDIWTTKLPVQSFFWLMEAILATDSRPIVNMCLGGIREAYAMRGGPFREQDPRGRMLPGSD